jgi:ABC-type polysaccharide/polyol phosphate transport system ATPase subunit
MGGGIEVAGLWQGYQRKNRRGYRTHEVNWALSDITLSVVPGEILGVVGGNGSGKTTLLQCLAGVLAPMKGTVEAHGRVGSLIDVSSGFHRELTGRENLMVGLVLAGVPRRRAEQLHDRISDLAGLEPGVLDTPVFTYSAGMILRLGFAILIHTEPDVVVLDEVLAVGDAAFSSSCLQTLHELRDEGRAVVLASHDLDLVRAECSRVAVLDHGRLAALDAPDAALDVYLQGAGIADAAPPAPAAVGRLWQRTLESRRRSRA